MINQYIMKIKSKNKFTYINQNTKEKYSKEQSKHKNPTKAAPMIFPIKIFLRVSYKKSSQNMTM